MKKAKTVVEKKSVEKTKTEWVLVDTVSTFRIRYCVEVPTGKHFVALNKVAAQEAKEFSQLHIGEQVISNRVITMKEALKMCREENSYVDSWADDKVVESFFHTKGSKAIS